MSRCLECYEKDGKHATQCSHGAFSPKQTLKEEVTPEQARQAIALAASVKVSKATKTLLGFEGPIPAYESKRLSICVDFPTKLERLFIDQNIALMTTVMAIYVGTRMMVWTPVAGSLFATGVWPRRPTDKLEEFGIDLSSWPTARPSQMITIEIRNNACNQVHFQGCLEALSIQQ